MGSPNRERLSRAVKRGPVLRVGRTVRNAIIPERPFLVSEVRRLSDRVANLQQQVDELEQGLQESRRLNLRVAELTDIVTELVLPLHDREIDTERLRTLEEDTL